MLAKWTTGGEKHSYSYEGSNVRGREQKNHNINNFLSRETVLITLRENFFIPLRQLQKLYQERERQTNETQNTLEQRFYNLLTTYWIERTRDKGIHGRFVNRG